MMLFRPLRMAQRSLSRSFVVDLEATRVKIRNDTTLPPKPHCAELIFDLVHRYAPVSLPQLYSLAKADPEVAEKLPPAKRMFKIHLRNLVKKQRVFKMKNPVDPTSNFVFHLGNGAIPEHPELCPNTDAFAAHVEELKANMKAEEEVEEKAQDNVEASA